MITIGDKPRDVLMLVAALCWAFVIFASWQGALTKNEQLIYFGLMTMPVLVVIYLLMGAVVNQQMHMSVLIWPVLFNGITQAVAFTIVYMTKGQKLEFILGMHPGFFGAIIFFWLGNFLTSTLSFALLFDTKAVPDDEWDTFMKEVAAPEKLH